MHHKPDPREWYLKPGDRVEAGVGVLETFIVTNRPRCHADLTIGTCYRSCFCPEPADRHPRLAEIGKPFEIEQREQVRQNLRRIRRSIKGKVPALIRDDGSLLSEFPVIAPISPGRTPERADPDGHRRRIRVPGNDQGIFGIYPCTCKATLALAGREVCAERNESYGGESAGSGLRKAGSTGQNDESTVKTGSSKNDHRRFRALLSGALGAGSTASESWGKLSGAPRDAICGRC